MRAATWLPSASALSPTPSGANVDFGIRGGYDKNDEKVAGEREYVGIFEGHQSKLLSDPDLVRYSQAVIAPNCLVLGRCVASRDVVRVACI